MITFTCPAEVAEQRALIEELRLELTAIKTATLSDAEAADKIKLVVSQHAERAQSARILSHLVHGSTPARIAWPSDHTGAPIEPSAFDLLCALEPKRMQDALKKLVADSSHLRGPSSVERQRRAAELERALREAEIAEEDAITAAEARGLHIHRRPDADPAIILGE